jgi:hypothetical protein
VDDTTQRLDRIEAQLSSLTSLLARVLEGRDLPQVVSVAELARRASRSRAAIYARIHEGTLHARRVDNRLVISAEDAIQFLNGGSNS